MINVDGFTEAEEELMIDHAVRQMEKEMFKILPGVMLRRITRLKGFHEVPDFVAENIYRDLLSSVKFPYISVDDKEQAIRCFTVFCVECMRENENVETILEDIGLLVAEIFLKSACMLLHPEKRDEMTAELADELNIPILPMSAQKALVGWFMTIAARHVEAAFAAAFQEYHSSFNESFSTSSKTFQEKNIPKNASSKDDRKSRTLSYMTYLGVSLSTLVKVLSENKIDSKEEQLLQFEAKLSILIHDQLMERVMDVLQIPFIPKEWYEKYVNIGIDHLMGKLLDKEKLDTAGEAALMMAN